MKKIINLILALLLSGQWLTAQELYCHVQINVDKIEGTSAKEMFFELSNKLTEYLNSRKWTDAIFQDEERIPCNFVLTIAEVSANTYAGDIQVQANRPVFNS